jgi:hypothetical protein
MRYLVSALCLVILVVFQAVTFAVMNSLTFVTVQTARWVVVAELDASKMLFVSMLLY